VVEVGQALLQGEKRCRAICQRESKAGLGNTEYHSYSRPTRKAELGPERVWISGRSSMVK
jgi:hypothetical protein